MHGTIKTTIFSLIFFSVCCGAYADVLHLKSGDSLEGSVVSESDEKVTFRIEGVNKGRAFVGGLWGVKTRPSREVNKGSVVYPALTSQVSAEISQ